MRRAMLVVASLSAAFILCAACSSIQIEAQNEERMTFFSRSYAATPDQIYFALKWALDESDWPLATENLVSGVLETAWRPTASDSHYIDIFNEKTYGANGAYYRLEIKVEPEGGRTNVKVGSRIKAFVKNLKSSGREEKKVLDFVGNYLRRGNPTITNLGVQE